MLYIQDKVAKLGDVILGGQVSSVEVQEVATIHTAQDDKGKIKKTQPVGYDNAKVMIDIILEDGSDGTTLDQLTNMQSLFKAEGQEQAVLFPIVNEDCAARGIMEVYFKSFSSKKVISESKRIASLELWAPKIAGITVIKRTGDAAAGAAVAAPKSKSKKSASKSPAKDTRSTAGGKASARRIVKKGIQEW